MWYYLPVAVRLIDKDDINGISGAHLVSLNHETQSVEESFVIAVNHSPNPRRFKIIVNSHDPNDKADPLWYNAEIDSEHQIEPQFCSGIHELKRNGFQLFPHDSIQSPVYSFLKLKILETDRFTKANKARYLKLQYSEGSTGEAITVLSFPYNFTNSVLFANFTSSGTICSKLASAYLSDLKYLENMIGGVTLLSGGTIGLVFGNLKKLNGDGELLVIIPWNTIWRSIYEDEMQFERSIFNLGFSHDSASQDSLTLASLNIFPVVVKHKSGVSWGSSVFYNSSTIITNNHVISPCLDGATVLIHYDNQNSISISKDQIHSPYPELDLSFIYITNEQAELISHIVPVHHSNYFPKYEVGDEVVTKGFGLFVNTKTITPLHSKGIINAVFKDPINSLIITSSACWNGSSGGGLFTNNDEFIGLICSNAQVTSPSTHHEIAQASTKKLEKLSKFVFILPVELIKWCYEGGEISQKVGDVWSLKSSHRDIVLQESKL